MMNHLLRTLAAATAIAAGTALAAPSTQAAPSAASAPGGQPPGPPPEAVEACKGKTEGTSVSFKGRQGETFSGTCQLANGVLAARPTGGSGQPPGMAAPKR